MGIWVGVRDWGKGTRSPPRGACGAVGRGARRWVCVRWGRGPPPQIGVPRPHSLALHLVHCGCVDGEVASESGASCSPSPAASRAESPTPIGRSRRHATQRFSPPSGFCHAVGGSAIFKGRGGLLRSAVGGIRSAARGLFSGGASSDSRSGGHPSNCRPPSPFWME